MKELKSYSTHVVSEFHLANHVTIADIIQSNDMYILYQYISVHCMLDFHDEQRCKSISKENHDKIFILPKMHSQVG